ncbi:MAG TPA: hypothetical protein VFG89_09990 [Coriobacteriia bacterium]|nr:hypothetical protein [Coriobacteriia bacterium]
MAVASGAAALLGIAGAVFAEALIAALVAWTHPAVAFAILTTVCFAISSLISVAFDLQTDDEGRHPLLTRVRRWIARHRDAAQHRFGRLASLSEGVAFVVLSVTAGPFITTLAMKLRGVPKSLATLLRLATSGLFAVCWVAIYNGLFAALGLLFYRLT